MNVEEYTYVYNSDAAIDTVESVLEELDARDGTVELTDVAAADDPDAARREAMFVVRESMGIGSNPDGIHGEDGEPDFSAGVLVTEAPTGRRDVHVGEDALAALEDDGANG